MDLGFLEGVSSGTVVGLRCGGLGAQPQDTDKVLILQCLKFNETYCLKSTILQSF